MILSIFPDANAKGVDLMIPMPGHHTVNEKEKKSVSERVEQLDKLIKEHDVIFLLTDSRESRWLPTLLAMQHRKLTINAAMGFDTFVVMRHGVPPEPESKSPEHSRLGCYFCNDVVAPRDSLTDRTLDQQCTVTRPGLSLISSAIAVELAIATLSHPLGAATPAEEKKDVSTPSSTELGMVPHQIRGYLTHYVNLIVTGQYYNRCVACSDYVLNEYNKRGLDFIFDALTNPIYIEDLTGITKMKEEELSIDWDVDELVDDDF